MSLSEQRKLVSVTINLSAKTIDVLWMDQVMKNGLVISETPHRGAYPINDDGEPDDSVVSDLGKTMGDILGEALASSQASLITANSIVANRNEVISQQAEQLTSLNQVLKNTEYQSTIETNQLKMELENYQEQIIQLQKELEEAQLAKVVEEFIEPVLEKSND